MGVLILAFRIGTLSQFYIPTILSLTLIFVLQDQGKRRDTGSRVVVQSWNQVNKRAGQRPALKKDT